MAVDYDLEMASRLNKKQAFELLAKHFDAQISDDGVVVDGPNLLVFGHDFPHTHMTEMYEEAFHFTPTLSLSFRWRKECDFRAFYRTTLRASMLMLEYAGDSVMIINEVTVFQRLGGELIFNTDGYVWMAEDEQLIQEEVRAPHELRLLPRVL